MTDIKIDIESQIAIDLAISEQTKGEQGETGAQGAQGESGAQGEKGDKGDKGDAGEGVAIGGDTGQVLAKASNDDFDTEWIDQSTGGGGEVGGLTKPYAFYSSGNLFVSGLSGNFSTENCFANQINLQGIIVSEDISLSFLAFGFFSISDLFARMTIYELDKKTGMATKVFESPVIEQENASSWIYDIPEIDRISLFKTRIYLVGINISKTATIRSTPRGEASLTFGQSAGFVSTNSITFDRKRVFSVNHNSIHPESIDINLASNSNEALVIGMKGSVL